MTAITGYNFLSHRTQNMTHISILEDSPRERKNKQTKSDTKPPLSSGGEGISKCNPLGGGKLF